MFSPLTKQLIEALQGLPGIGPKSAQRMAFHLLTDAHHAKALNLADALQQAIQKVRHCEQCRLFTEHRCCDICQNPKRDRSLMCVLESPADVVAIEQTHTYTGLYFVLQGHLSPLDGIGPEEIGIPLLLSRLKTEDIKELVIATNPTMEGKATAHYIANQVDTSKIKCSRIAHGVPMGGELEYLDASTLSHAFQSRTSMESSIK